MRNTFFEKYLTLEIIMCYENDVVVNKKVEKNTNTNSGININLCNNQIVNNPIKFVIN